MRTLRKRWALSQSELGHLLGGLSTTSVARIELGKRAPTLTVLLRYQVIFGASSAELVPSLYKALEDDVLSRAAALSIRLEGRKDGDSALKRRLLSDMISRVAANPASV